MASTSCRCTSPCNSTGRRRSRSTSGSATVARSSCSRARRSATRPGAIRSSGSIAGGGCAPTPTDVTVVEGATGADPDAGPLDDHSSLLRRYRTYTPSELPTSSAVRWGSSPTTTCADWSVCPAPSTPTLARRGLLVPRGDADLRPPASLDHRGRERRSSKKATTPRRSSPRVNVALDEIVGVLFAGGPARDPATERLVATAPSLRADVDIRSIAAGLVELHPRGLRGRRRTGEASTSIAGDVFQVVPSQQFRRPTSVDPLTLYRVLRSLNPSPYMYLLDTGDSQIVGASPEMLMRVARRIREHAPDRGHPASRRQRGRGPRTRSRAVARREGDRRARHAGRPRTQRRRPRRVARHRARRAT